MSAPELFRRRVAWPEDHGAWVFLLAPLLIGLRAGERWSTTALYLTVAALAAFLIRQPITVAVKVGSSRRGRRELPAAVFWIAFYGGVGALHVLGLVLRGYGYLLYLGIPALPVFVWYLVLVRRRAERRRLGVEILAAGALALSAPAGRWLGVGQPDAVGWLIWMLTWGQAAASLLYVRSRLARRERDPAGEPEQGSYAGPAVALSLGNLAAAAGLCFAGLLPAWVWIAFTVQAAEAAVGPFAADRRAAPPAIGLRQLAVSALFTLLFVAAWG